MNQEENVLRVDAREAPDVLRPFDRGRGVVEVDGAGVRLGLLVPAGDGFGFVAGFDLLDPELPLFVHEERIQRHLGLLGASRTWSQRGNRYAGGAREFPVPPRMPLVPKAFGRRKGPPILRTGRPAGPPLNAWRKPLKTDSPFRATLRRSALPLALLVSFVSSFSAGWAGVSPASSRSETERNKAVARRVYDEGLSQGRFEVPYTPGFVGHGGAVTFRHEDGIREAKGWRSAFPDLRVVVDLAVAEGDLVSVRWTARGTNTGTGNGIPATGRKVEISGTTIFRFEGGAIAEEWTSGDTLGLMRQLGLLPSPAASASRPE